MALYLVQHGAAFTKQQDPARGLTQEGAADVERIAGVASNYGIRVARILHSGKPRAEQTAGILAKHLKPSDGVRAMEGMGPDDDVQAVAERMDTGRDWMLVGHLPFLERLTTWLVTGQQGKRIFRFQNGGIVCLDRDDVEGGWVIRWALMPKIG